MTPFDLQLECLLYVGADRARREGRPIAVECGPVHWTVRPAAEPTPDGYERIAEVGPDDHTREAQVSIAKRVYAAYHSGRPVSKAVREFLGMQERPTPPELLGDGLIGAIEAKAQADRLEPGRVPNPPAMLRTIETPYRNARGNVVVVQGGPIKGTAACGHDVDASEAWHEAEILPGNRGTAYTNMGYVWTDLPSARAAIDAKYGGAVDGLDTIVSKPEAGGAVEGAKEPGADKPAGCTCEFPYELPPSISGHAIGCPEHERWAEVCLSHLTPKVKVERKETLANGTIRRWLSNGWFVDHAKTAAHRHLKWRYSAWEPGADSGGKSAAFRTGGDTLQAVMAKVESLAAAEAFKAPVSSPAPEPVPGARPKSDPRFAIMEEESLGPDTTRWRLANGWYVIRSDDKSYRQCGWRLSAWEPAASGDGLSAFRAGGDTMAELMAKLPAAAGLPLLEDNQEPAAAPAKIPEAPAEAVAAKRGRGGRKKAPVPGQGFLFD